MARQPNRRVRDPIEGDDFDDEDDQERAGGQMPPWVSIAGAVVIGMIGLALVLYFVLDLRLDDFGGAALLVPLFAAVIIVLGRGGLKRRR